MLLQRLQRGDEVSAEAQTAIRVFNDFDVAFELTATKRFAPGDPLPELLISIRNADPSADRAVDPHLWALLQRQCVKTDLRSAVQTDPRLKELRFQCGHGVGLYHQTTIKFFYARATREASRLGVPLYWCQAADDVKGLASQPENTRKLVMRGLVRTWNIHYTAKLHTLLPLYVGQRVRLTEKLSADDMLVQEAEGTVVDVVLDPADGHAPTRHSQLLSHAPLGAWVRFDKCVTAPLSDHL